MLGKQFKYLFRDTSECLQVKALLMLLWPVHCTSLDGSLAEVLKVHKVDFLGIRININAKAGGRCRGGISRGKAKVPSGRPKGITTAKFKKSKLTMPVRKEAKGKRLHSLNRNVSVGLQNGGKW